MHQNALMRAYISWVRSNSAVLLAIAAALLLSMLLIGWSAHVPAPRNLSGLFVLPASVGTPEAVPATTTPEVEVPQFRYIEVLDGCGPNYEGVCVNLRSGPGENYSVLARLRTGIVLKVASVVTGGDGRQWYKIAFDSEVRYPDRVSGNWYVAAETVHVLNDDGDHVLSKGDATTTKHIVVDISKQMLYAYDGDELFMQEPISTGLEFTPTPRGTFTIYKMTPSRYMQGPLPGVSDQYYDLPGVPWNLYFTVGGAVIHGAYWHENFGRQWSHGCVNLPPQKAKELYLWAVVGTNVIVQN